METELRLDTFTTGTIDASGNARSLSIGPSAYGERWHITLMSCSGGNRARLEVYRGDFIAAGRKLDGTDRADNDTSVCDIWLRVGERVSFSWSRGTTGTIMTVTLQGERYVLGKRGY